MHSPLPWDILQWPLLQCGDFLSFIPAAFLYTLPPSLFFFSSSCQPPPLPRIQTSHKRCAIDTRPKTLCHCIHTSISGGGLLQSRGSRGGRQDPQQWAGGGLEKPVRWDPDTLMLEKISKRRIHLPIPLGISFQVGSIIQEPVNVAQSAFASLVGSPSRDHSRQKRCVWCCGTAASGCAGLGSVLPLPASLLCSSFAQKALGSEIMVPRALALELGDALRGGRALPPPETYSSPQ